MPVQEQQWEEVGLLGGVWALTGIAGRCLDSDWDLSEAAALVVVALQGGFGGSPSSAQPCLSQSPAFAEALPVRS